MAAELRSVVTSRRKPSCCTQPCSTHPPCGLLIWGPLGRSYDSVVGAWAFYKMALPSKGGSVVDTNDYWAKPIMGRERIIPSLDSSIAADDPVRISNTGLSSTKSIGEP